MTIFAGVKVQKIILIHIFSGLNLSKIWPFPSFWLNNLKVNQINAWSWRLLIEKPKSCDRF